MSSQSSIEDSESMAVGNFDLSNVRDSNLKYSIIQNIGTNCIQMKHP